MSEQRQQRARDTELAELGQEVGTLVTLHLVTTWSPPGHHLVTTHCPVSSTW